MELRHPIRNVAPEFSKTPHRSLRRLRFDFFEEIGLLGASARGCGSIRPHPDLTFTQSALGQRDMRRAFGDMADQGGVGVGLAQFGQKEAGQMRGHHGQKAAGRLRIIQQG